MEEQKITFRCTECDALFEGPAKDWNGTVYVTPVLCPHCGSIRTCPSYSRRVAPYEPIWAEMEASLPQDVRSAAIDNSTPLQHESDNPIGSRMAETTYSGQNAAMGSGEVAAVDDVSEPELNGTTDAASGEEQSWSGEETSGGSPVEDGQVDKKKKRHGCVLTLLILLVLLVLVVCLFKTVVTSLTNDSACSWLTEKVVSIKESIGRLTANQPDPSAAGAAVNTEQEAADSVEVEVDTMSNDVQRVRQLLETYGEAGRNNNFQVLESHYADHINQFYHKHDLTRAQVMKLLKNYDKVFSVAAKSADIEWPSLEVDVSDDITHVTYNATYSITHKDGSSELFIKTKHLDLNADGKIVAVY